MTKRLASLLATFLLLACGREAPGPGAAQGPAPGLDALLGAAVENGQVPGVVAMVATVDGVVYERGERFPVDGIFAIASMTKPVTSVAVMQLVEAGKVRLDEPVQTYLPELAGIQVLENGALRPPRSAPTVRHLLTHTSGFAYDLFNPDIAALAQAGKTGSALNDSDAFLSAPLVFDPGSRFEYGINTDWLGRLIERVSGQTLEDYFHSSIFEPLGMTDTYFNVPPEKHDRLVAQYARGPDGAPAALPSAAPQPVNFLSGGSGLHSTASDYLKFARAILRGGELDGRRILSAASVGLMAQDQIGDLSVPPLPSQYPDLVVADVAFPGNVDGFGLGFGLNRAPIPAGRGAGTLSWGGLLSTYFWIDRENGVCAVVFAHILPFGDPAAVKLVNEFDREVYRLYGAKP
jgi:CubicO group peptidase (beta-lactamase class C family)